MKHPNEMKKQLPCGCVIGFYSIVEKYCDRHYQQMLDERYKDDIELCSLGKRILKENENGQIPPIS